MRAGRIRRETAVSHRDLQFESDTVHACREFPLVDLLVKEAAEFVVDREHMLHHVKRERTKLRLGDATRLNRERDGHELNGRKMCGEK